MRPATAAAIKSQETRSAAPSASATSFPHRQIENRPAGEGRAARRIAEDAKFENA